MRRVLTDLGRTDADTALDRVVREQVQLIARVARVDPSRVEIAIETPQAQDCASSQAEAFPQPADIAWFAQRRAAGARLN